ncbi:unnamed protein product [Pleuronectes platessa]|uniref:Uncharacterized protein n=1 Tax=Pleuronectes platessa TaxID=8262 RepID=A0A9N7W0D2_PLEPL|nr:unnamed protein product [Pleuronectes platessa]
MEEELAIHLKQLADQFHGLAPVKCCELAFEYAEKNNIPVPANWTEKQCAAASSPHLQAPLLQHLASLCRSLRIQQEEKLQHERLWNCFKPPSLVCDRDRAGHQCVFTPLLWPHS